ncbi:outer membrane beta-barrel protein [Larkinella humicola]|uniref:TonB-dependent receptor n=1 Tax=Larkinella humicola TaxID=2607654 RepID=A0A5N1JFT6_9BACT|nr:outer membrane beta-barrel protein [Larkinella humicola]KAA9349609.1 TonB-dependent receptor [Larkinella humicola]
MARYTLIAFLFLIARSISAQTITGTVLDPDRQPAPLAVVKLLKATDSTLIRGTATNDLGQYHFPDVAPGTYCLQLSLVAMRTLTSRVVGVRPGETVVMEPLTFQPADQTLAVVTVRARKSYVDQEIDKTVLNVAADASAQSKTVYEVLQQAPGVVIDPNDNLRMAGKQGVNVFIDGKPTNLSTTDLANLLRATPASNIDRIDLIANPSARYDAQGGAGIINIRFRRAGNLGLNGNVSGSYARSDHYRSNLALDLNYRAKKVNVYGNVSGSDNYQRTNVQFDRQAGGAQFLQRGYDRDGTRAVVYKAGFDYFINSKETIGLIISGNRSANRFGTYTKTAVVAEQNRVDSSIVNRVDNPNQNNRINAAFNYRYADTLGLEVMVDVDVTRFNYTSPSRIRSDYLGQDGQALLTRQYRFDPTTDINIVALKADGVKEWKPSHLKLEAGLKHTNVATDNDLLAYTGAEQQADVTRTNRFRYQEMVSAVYASLNRSVGKWAIQAGLRGEKSTIRGQSVDLAGRTINRPDTAYFNLFPTGFVQYQATGKSQFALNYGWRIGRPNYQDLNPFIYQLDPYTSQRGNPFLRPAYSHNGSLAYTYKWATTLKLTYTRTNDFSTDVIQQTGLTAYQTVANVGRVNALNISLSTPYTITKWWNTYLYMGATWNHFRGRFTADQPFNERGFGFDGYMQHSFTLSKRWTAQVSGFWNAPTTQTIYRIGGLGALNMSLETKVFGERGKLTLSVDDMLNTMRWRQSAAFASQQFSVERKWESRRVALRFAYRFGRREIAGARDRQTGVDAGRIKTKDNL